MTDSDARPESAADDEEPARFVPVMTCAEAKAFEKKFFAERTDVSEEDAMRAAGTGAGDAVLRECGAALERSPRLLVLAGKGHNGGDALRAAARVFSRKPCRVALVFFAEDENALSPLTRKFFGDFMLAVPAEKRITAFLSEKTDAVPQAILDFVAAPHIALDGVFGHSFRPPFPPSASKFLREISAASSAAALRCCVDLPSGLCDSGAADCAFPRADFTFPTGILKRPLLRFPEFAGRIVPVNIAFPVRGCGAVAVSDETWFLKKIFSPRPLLCDKRDFGHVLIIGGSRAMPGALLMNALSALCAGAGLVSVVCPERVQAAFAARAPGAMWIPCPENSDGGLARLPALAEIRRMLPRVSAVLCGSGAGTSDETQALIRDVAAAVPPGIPLLLDADALRAETLSALRERGAPPEKTVLLPHAGEYARMGGNAAALRDFCREHSATVALKGAATRVADPDGEIFTFSGTPALARGGSGDVLAGIAAAVFASERNFCPGASARERLAAAVVWHGNAARRLASAQGERCADVSALPEFLCRVF